MEMLLCLSLLVCCYAVEVIPFVLDIFNSLWLHLKVMFLSLITHPHVVLNLRSSSEQK